VRHFRTVIRYAYSGTESRTVTITVTRCAGKDTTSTTSSAWSTAKIIATVVNQRL
jgi:hypothetical protein